jgi:hypothetical protein
MGPDASEQAGQAASANACSTDEGLVVMLCFSQLFTAALLASVGFNTWQMPAAVLFCCCVDLL